MTWQTEQVEATDTYREALTSWCSVMTSKHVSAVVVNAGGSSFVVGDTITITHASAYHDLELEVTAVSSGAITAVRINKGGAFALRLASAAVNAGGSGYAVDDVLEIQDGTGSSTEKAKVKVATLSGSAVATVTVFETGGAYTTTPTTTAAATIGIGPAAFAGDDACTLDLTMQAIIGTTAIAQSSTSGSGTGATFDLTLTDGGWATQYSKNNATFDSLTDEKEVVLLGTVAGADAPYIGFISYRQDSAGQKRYGIACFGMLGFNPGLALASQPGIGPIAWALGSTSGAHILVAEEVAENNSWWISVTERRITGVIRGNISGENDSYHSFYCGLLNGFGPATTSPYPMFIGASSNTANRRTSNESSTGLAEAYQDPSGSGPLYYLRKSDLSWVTVKNATGASPEDREIMFPRGVMEEASGADLLIEDDNYKNFADGTLGSRTRANVANKIYPAPGANDEFTPLPLTVMSAGSSGGANDVDTTVVGELDGVFFTGGVDASGTVHTPEDYLEDANGVRYRVFPNSTPSLSNRPYQFFCIRED